MNNTYIVAGIIAVAIIFWIVSRFNGGKRGKAIKKLAESMNYTFSAKGNETLSSQLYNFNLFSKGHSQKISNVITGTRNNIRITILDYKFTTGGGKSSHTYEQSVIFFESDKLHLPEFILRPESLFDKIGQVFSNKDIDFKMYPLFSKKFLLRGNDEESIRSLFTDSVLRVYEQHQHLSTEANGSRLIIYQISKRVSPDRIESFIQEGSDIVELFKT
jgi:hypothetical protein